MMLRYEKNYNIYITVVHYLHPESWSSGLDLEHGIELGLSPGVGVGVASLCVPLG